MRTIPNLLWGLFAMALCLACDNEQPAPVSPADDSIDTTDSRPPGGGGRGPRVYTTGDSQDVQTNTQSGTVLMGGGPDVDAAIQWMIDRSGGGDFVVIRASGSNGYNDYIYSQLGGVNSVETIIIDSRSDADHITTESLILNAEAVFIAGGDQYDYVSFWKNTRTDAALNYVRNVKKIPVGGSSAGLAILGEFYYGADNGTVYSYEALDDPYDYYMTGIDGRDFLDMPYLQNTITDTHFSERDRRGRLLTFMARLVEDFGVNYQDVRGIGVDEETAACIDENGTARVFGYGDVYFARGYGGSPENCQPGQPLTWNRSNRAVDVYRVAGNSSGSNSFSVATWSGGSGGQAFYWYAQDGSFYSY